MSEAEKKKRQDYKRNRKRWMAFQIVMIVLATVVASAFLYLYNQMNQTYYIEYTENGNVDYKVYLKENEFFEEEWLGPDQAYISELIDRVMADFSYVMRMDTDNVGFDYTYRIDAQLQIKDTDTGSSIYDPVFSLLPEQTKSVEGAKTIRIKEKVAVDYISYNDLASRFVEAYGIEDFTSYLDVTLHVNVISRCSAFEENNENEYAVTLQIPLTDNTLGIRMTSSVPDRESSVLACTGTLDQNLFRNTGLIAAGVDLVLIVILIVFLHLTRNEDINYTIKVKRLVSSYRSYIQTIENEFDTEGYQILYVKTFTEMLGIRDTIQSPILMSENADQTRTQFIIPTATKILYVFEIKVDNYDALYATPVVTEDAAEEPAEAAAE